jgi:hypothetical protein
LGLGKSAAQGPKAAFFTVLAGTTAEVWEKVISLVQRTSAAKAGFDCKGITPRLEAGPLQNEASFRVFPGCGVMPFQNQFVK